MLCYVMLCIERKSTIVSLGRSTQVPRRSRRICVDRPSDTIALLRSKTVMLTPPNSPLSDLYTSLCKEFQKVKMSFEKMLSAFQTENQV